MDFFTRATIIAAVAALLLGPATVARAQTTLIDGLGGTAGYGTDGQCLSKNDDGSSASIDITPYFPGGLQFFDRTHTSVYVNTNGNITFDGPVSAYTPESFPIADQPMIAPYWADVDIRRQGGTCEGIDGVTCEVCEPCHNPADNGVWWHLEEGRMVVTWDRVGRYDCKNDARMAFQLVLTAAEATCGGAGDFDVEFRFAECEWEVGDASGDANGNGTCEAGEATGPSFPPGFRTMCTPAQSGFDAGNRTDFVSIMGSMDPGIHTALCTGSNVGETGVWRFEIRSGTVVCPDAGDTCDTGMMGVCASGLTNCVGSGTECVPEVEATSERCDALDNDCDGMVDESPDTLCGVDETCIDGTCLAPCFEAGCPEGQICLSGGRCIDAACEGVECPEGQRCSDGTCVGACDGITCPAGQTCRSGRCVDLCAELTCDDCTVCEAGVCVLRCDYAECDAGETCLDDGRCVDSDCADVSCAAGEVCVDGACVDACEGAVCPSGEECVGGDCVPMPTVDGGVPPRRDGGTTGGSDGGTTGGSDGGGTGGGIDGSTAGSGRSDDSGCGCRVLRPADDTGGGLAFATLLLVAAWRMGRARGRK